MGIGLACLSVLISSCQLPTEQEATPPPAKPDARVGGTLTVGITAPGGIDPVNAYEPMGKLIVSTMCDTVVTLDPETGQVREGLASKIVFAPDGTTLTFTMRRELKFSDGTPLEPTDVDFSYRLLHARSTASYVRDLVKPFAAGISGAVGEDAEEEESVLAEDEVGDAIQPIAQAMNEADFQMFTKEGKGAVIRALAEPAFAPISEAAYRRDPVAFSRNPVCIGPYKLAKPYRPGARSITLVRNGDYHAQNVGYTGGGRGYLDKIVFRIYPTAGAAYAAYAKRQVDLVAVPPAKAADARRFGAALITGPATTVEYLGLPTGIEPFNNVDVRRALSAALDREKLAVTLGAANAPAPGFLPQALNIHPGENGIRTGALQSKANSGATFAGCGDATPAKGDTAAKALLAKASTASGLREVLAKPLTLYVNDDGRYPAMARLAARQWKATLGLTVQVKPLRWADYLQKASQGPGFDGAFHVAWASDATAPVPMFNDPQVFLAPLFTSEGLSNWARWTSTDFDFAFTEDAAKATDVRERGLLFQRIEELLCSEMPMIPVAVAAPQFLIRHKKFASARSSYLSVSTGMPLLREIYRP